MLLQDAHPQHGHCFWRKTVTRCVTLMGNSNPAGPSTGESSARAMLQLLSTAEVKMNRNLRVDDDQLLRLIKLHQGYNPAARRDSNEAWGEIEMVFLQHRSNKYGSGGSFTFLWHCAELHNLPLLQKLAFRPNHPLHLS